MLRTCLLAAMVLLGTAGCTGPRRLDAAALVAEPGLADAARSVVPMVFVPRAVLTGSPEPVEVHSGSAVVLAADRLLTAAHVVVGRLAEDGQGAAASFSVIGERPRRARILRRGDPEAPLGDWAILETEPVPGPAVRGLAEPVVGERCVVIGYPSRLLPAGWGDGIPIVDPQGGSSWRPPRPVVLEGRVARLEAWDGYRVAMDGPRGPPMDGISGGGAFVERDGHWMLIGVVSNETVSPFHREFGVRPLNKPARDAWNNQPPASPAG